MRRAAPLAGCAFSTLNQRLMLKDLFLVVLALVSYQYSVSCHQALSLVDSFEATLVLTPSREEAAQARLLEAQHILRIWNRRQGPFAGPIKRV